MVLPYRYNRYADSPPPNSTLNCGQQKLQKLPLGKGGVLFCKKEKQLPSALVVETTTASDVEITTASDVVAKKKIDGKTKRTKIDETKWKNTLEMCLLPVFTVFVYFITPPPSNSKKSFQTGLRGLSSSGSFQGRCLKSI